jgi:hypothetical protein
MKTQDRTQSYAVKTLAILPFAAMADSLSKPMKRLLNLCLFLALMAGTTIKAQPVINIQPVAAAEFTPNGLSNPTSYTEQSCLYLGNTANLNVAATGALSYQWTLNGTPLSGATTTNLLLSNIQASQAGLYACVISNATGSVTSSVVAVQPWAQMSWVGPATLTSDSVLTLPGNPPVLEANAFGGTPEVVTVSATGVIIDFRGASSAVATVNQNGQYNAFATTITGNANFDLVLDEGSYDGPITVDGNGCKIITFKDLTPGNPYAVLLIGLDDRSCCDTRVVWFQDAYDLANVTTNFTMGANDYVIGSFIAGGTTETINEPMQIGSGNIQCLVVYELTNAPQLPVPLAAYPAETNFAGTTVTLSPGSLLGQLPFNYQWLSGATKIQNATNAMLVLPNTTTKDSGNYSVVVSNSYGAVTSAPIALTISAAAPPEFTTNVTAPPTLFLGDPLTLVAGVAGSPPISLQWRLNGSSVPGATNAILAVSSLQASQSGTYTLVASNAFGSLTNTPVTVTVKPFSQFNWSPPAPITTADAILDQIGTEIGAVDFANNDTVVTLSDGNTIDFTGDTSVASVNGNGTFNGAYSGTTGNSSFDSVLAGANYDDGPKTVTLYNLSPGAQYAVQLFGLDDRTCCGTRVLYFQDPLDTNNVSQSFAEQANDYVLGTFWANGTNQDIIEQTPGVPGVAGTAGAGNMNALVLYALPQSAEVWQAPAASPADTNFSGVVVTLSDPLVTGVPPIYYQWQLASTNLPNATNSTLVLANTVTNDSGNYRLLVSNSFGISTSAPVALTIKPSSAPQFTTSVTQPPTLFLDGTVKLVAGVAGTPPIALQWQFNGSNILGATNATLTLTALQASQSGAYTLVASNFLKAVTNTPVALTVEPFLQFSWGTPAPITTADAILGQIGTVFGAVDFDNADTTVTLSDGTNIDFTGDTSVASVTGNGTYGDFLNGLALTTNASFNTVLSGGNYDGGPKTITLYGLTPGNLYAVQLFAVEDRWQDFTAGVPIPERQVYFQDPNDTNNVTQIITEGANDYVVGQFMANSTNQIIIEQTPGVPGNSTGNGPNGNAGNGNANALVVYSVPPAANAWLPPIASPSSTVPVGTTVTLSDPAVTGLPPFSYQWLSITGNTTNKIPGATNSTLVLANVLAPPLPGGYALLVSNKSGTNISPPLALQVLNEPVFTTDGAGWTLNDGASISNGVVTMTDGVGGEQTSFFFDTPMYIGAFRASFTYQATGTAPLAEGMTLCLQNNVQGPVMVGGSGGELGFGGIPNSAGLALNINSDYTNGYALVVDGNVASGGPPGGYTPAGSVNLASGDPINVKIAYDGNIITLTFVDSTVPASFTTNLAVGPLSSTNILGADTASIGFTAGTGAEFSTQTVSNFTFTPLVPLSASLGSGDTVVVGWPTAVGGYVLQSTTNLAQSWTTVPPPYTVANGKYQVTVPVTGGAFYRLQLPPNLPKE